MIFSTKNVIHQSSPVIVDYRRGVHVVYTRTQIFLQGQELAHKIKITTATYCRLSQSHTKQQEEQEQQQNKHIIQNKRTLRIQLHKIHAGMVTLFP